MPWYPMSWFSPRSRGARLLVGAATAVLALPLLTMPAYAQGDASGATCGGRELGPNGETHVGDGIPDQRGRIAYSIVGRYDPMFGPVGAGLYLIDPDGSDASLVLDCEVIRPQWSPDGSHLAFSLGMQDGSWQLATVAADGSDLRVLTSGPGIHEIPAWSQDGSWLAYDSSPVGLDDPTFRTRLSRVEADGSEPMLLGDPAAFDVEPRLSPDGARVVFGRLYPEHDFAGQILVRDLRTGEERALTELGWAVEHPEWSPDGRSIIFNEADGSQAAGTVYTLLVDYPEARPKVLLEATSGWIGVKPVYSPDGANIVFVCRPVGGEQDDLCLMAADGTGITPLVAAADVSENHPTWGVAPAGRIASVEGE